jgi:hypothetical protein
VAQGLAEERLVEPFVYVDIGSQLVQRIRLIRQRNFLPLPPLIGASTAMNMGWSIGSMAVP